MSVHARSAANVVTGRNIWLLILIVLLLAPHGTAVTSPQNSFMSGQSGASASSTDASKVRMHKHLKTILPITITLLRRSLKGTLAELL